MTGCAARRAPRARRLASLSLAWLCFEGVATTTAGLLAGSIALVGNGLDGAIEGLASVIVIWRFSGSRTLSAGLERRAEQLVAVSFLLAPYVAFDPPHADSGTPRRNDVVRGRSFDRNPLRVSVAGTREAPARRAAELGGYRRAGTRNDSET